MQLTIRLLLGVFILSASSALWSFDAPLSEDNLSYSLNTQPQERIPRHLLIIGCGRSGTTYMTKVLQAAGWDISHEYMASAGSVSWLLTPPNNEWAPWGPLSKDYTFSHILHQVREPTKTIQSVYNTPPRATWEWVSTVVPEIQPNDSRLTKSAKYWYYWNLIAEARAEMTYRIEDFDWQYKEIAERIGLSLDKETIKSISKKTRTQRKSHHRTITWSILEEELDPDLYLKVCQLAKRYGYNTKD